MQGQKTIASYCSAIAIPLQQLYETSLPCHPESGWREYLPNIKKALIWYIRREGICLAKHQNQCACPKVFSWTVISGRLIGVIRDLTADSNICTWSGRISAVILSGCSGGKGVSWKEEVKTGWRERVINTDRCGRLWFLCFFQTK